MKLIFKIVVLTFFSTQVFAQNADSVSFAKAKWQRHSVAKKTQVYTYQFADSSLFNSNQFISFVEVKNHKKAPEFHIAFDEKKLIKTSIFATQNNAVAAINGTFFDTKNGGSVDYLKVGDSLINLNRLGKNNNRALHQRAAVAINKGKLSVLKWDGTESWEQQLPYENVMLSGPLLILDKTAEKLDSVPFNVLRHPRSAIGIRKDGSVLMLVADGRNTNAGGLSLFELTMVMQWLGCVAAINLDGGGSSALWAVKNGNGEIINHPSDNKLWDNNGERSVANAIYVRPKSKQ